MNAPNNKFSSKKYTIMPQVISYKGRVNAITPQIKAEGLTQAP
jgi:hypothetical protein